MVCLVVGWLCRVCLLEFDVVIILAPMNILHSTADCGCIACVMTKTLISDFKRTAYDLSDAMGDAVLCDI
jgi:hypothetical protein